MSEKRRIVVNTLANGAAQFAQMLSALVFMPFLLRAFGTTGYGLYLLASSVASYATLLDLGVGSSVIKMTAEARARGDNEGEGRIVSTALAFYVVIGVVAAAILATVALNTGVLFKVSADDARLLRNLFFVAAAWQLWIWPATTATATLMGHQRYKQTSATSILTVVLNIVATGTVLVLHQGPLALMIATIGASSVATFIQVFLAKRALGESRLSLRSVDAAGFKTIFSFAWAVFILQICSVILYQQTDRLVLGIFLGAVAVALYEAAGKFQGLASQLTTMSVSAVMPMASHLDAQGQDETLRRLFLRGTKYSLMLLNPVVVVLIIVARPLIGVWLRQPAFVAQAISAQILVSHQLLTAGTAVGDSMIIGRGQLPKRIPYVIGVALLNLALSVILVQRIGIMGVVLGTTIPWVLDFPFHIRLILKSLDVPVGRWLKETVLPTYPLLLLPAVLSWVLIGTSLQSTLWGIAVIGLTSVGAYWLAVYAFTFQPNERADVRSALSAVWQRVRGGQAPA